MFHTGNTDDQHTLLIYNMTFNIQGKASQLFCLYQYLYRFFHHSKSPQLIVG